LLFIVRPAYDKLLSSSLSLIKPLKPNCRSKEVDIGR